MRISDWSSDVCSSDLAAQTQALPAWDQLTPTQREQLIAPTRERWNAEPAQRAELLERAQRWQQMSPEQRKHAHRGVKRWRHMSERSEERRVGKEGVSTFMFRWSPLTLKKKKNT